MGTPGGNARGMQVCSPSGFVQLRGRPFVLEKPIKSPLGDHLTSSPPPGGAWATVLAGPSGTRRARCGGVPGAGAQPGPAPRRQAPPRGCPGARRPAVSARHAPQLAGRVRSRAPRRLRDRGGGRRRRSSPPRAMSSPAVERGALDGSREAAARPRSRGRFWEVGGGSGGRLERAAAESERWELLLRRGKLLALGGHLKGALEAYAAALRRGAPARPECLGTLVDCLVLSYRLRHGLGWSAPLAAGADAGAGGLLSCLGCRGFLSEPVTVPCGHSYCRRCLRRELRARCRLCRDRLPPAAAAQAEGTTPRPPPLAAAIAASGFRTSVVLNHLAEKWFPGQRERARAAGRLAELLHQGRYREALAAACEALRAGDRAGCGAGPATPPSSPRRAGCPELACSPRRPPEPAGRGPRGGGRGRAAGCFGHNGDRPGAACDAARGRRARGCLGLAVRRARPGRSGGGQGRRRASCCTLSGNRPPRPGRAEDPPHSRGSGCSVYLRLPQKSVGQSEAAGGRNCISGAGGRRALCNG